MVVKEQSGESPEKRLTPEQMAAWFPEADLILLEGFKDSEYPKLENDQQGREGAGLSLPESLQRWGKRRQLHHYS